MGGAASIELSYRMEFILCIITVGGRDSTSISSTLSFTSVTDSYSGMSTFVHRIFARLVVSFVDDMSCFCTVMVTEAMTGSCGLVFVGSLGRISMESIRSSCGRIT